MTSTVDAGTVDSRGTRHLKVAVIGSGFSGLGMAIQLRRKGIEDFLVFERADEVGGTWRDNSYPGCACDVMSLLYSFSFAQNPEWKSTFGKRQELFDYLKDCAEKFGIRPHLRLGHELLEAEWDRAARRWHLRTSQGDYTAQFLVTGTGYLSDAVVPQLPGLESFTGETFHSSRWNHDYDLTGKRVAVIGTGASAIQFVPEIQKVAGRLDVHQRTAPWVGPKDDKVIDAKELNRRRTRPGYQNFRRNFNMWGREILAFFMSKPSIAAKTIQGMAQKHLQASVADPVLRARLTPDYSVSCKRLLFSDKWYPAIQQPNVEVISDGITAIGPQSVTTADGTTREVDAIIFGTGFQATDRPVAHRIRGNDGVLLAEAWRDGMSAYRGTTVAGFPNLFMLLGPNTTLGHSSQTVMIEAQITYVLDALAQSDRRGLASVEITEQAQRAYNAQLDARLAGTVWTAGGCKSWYLDAAGRNPSIWPTYTWRFRKQTAKFDLAAYRVAAVTTATIPAATVVA